MWESIVVIVIGAAFIVAGFALMISDAVKKRRIAKLAAGYTGSGR